MDFVSRSSDNAKIDFGLAMWGQGDKSITTKAFCIHLKHPKKYCLYHNNKDFPTIKFISEKVQTENISLFLYPKGYNL